MPRRDDSGIVKRKLADGTVRYYVQFEDIDGVRRMKLARGARTRAEAKRIRDAARTNVMEGRAGIAPKPDEQQKAKARLTVGDLCDRFLKEYSNPKLKDRTSYLKKAESHFKHHIRKRLGARVVAALTVADMERFRDELLAGGKERLAKNSVRNILASARKMFNWAEKQKVISTNPMRGCTPPPAEEHSTFYTPAELSAILREVQKRGLRDYAWALFTANTGARKSETFALRWRHVRLDQRVVEITEGLHGSTKNQKPRTIPLRTEVVDVLRSWKAECPEIDGDLVFPVQTPSGWRRGRSDDASDWFREVVQKAVPAKGSEQVNPHPIHALRDAFGTSLAMHGVYERNIQELLGHKTPWMTRKYVHAAPEHLRAAVDALPNLTAPTDVANVVSLRRR